MYVLCNGIIVSRSNRTFNAGQVKKEKIKKRCEFALFVSHLLYISLSFIYFCIFTTMRSLFLVSAMFNMAANEWPSLLLTRNSDRIVVNMQKYINDSDIYNR